MFFQWQNKYLQCILVHYRISFSCDSFCCLSFNSNRHFQLRPRLNTGFQSCRSLEKNDNYFHNYFIFINWCFFGDFISFESLKSVPFFDSRTSSQCQCRTQNGLMCRFWKQRQKFCDCCVAYCL